MLSCLSSFLYSALVENKGLIYWFNKNVERGTDTSCTAKFTPVNAFMFKLTAQGLLLALLCYFLERHWTDSVFVLTCIVFTRKLSSAEITDGGQSWPCRVCLFRHVTFPIADITTLFIKSLF